MTQLVPMRTLLPIKTLGCIMVFCPIVAVLETRSVAFLKGLK